MCCRPTAAPARRPSLGRLWSRRMRSTNCAQGKLSESPITAAVAAISVGIVQGTPLLDLEYVEDSACDTDMNVVD